MKDSCCVKGDLLKYLRELEVETKKHPSNDRFLEGKIVGIKVAIDLIDGDLYYSNNGMLLNK